MEHEGSLACLQEPASDPYPESDESRAIYCTGFYLIFI
jgi:hypothetical protein